MPSEAMIAAAIRFKEAYDTAIKRSADDQSLTDVDIVEMHEAALGPIWATKTTTLQEALDVLHQWDA